MRIESTPSGYTCWCGFEFNLQPREYIEISRGEEVRKFCTNCGIMNVLFDEDAKNSIPFIEAPREFTRFGRRS